MKKTLITLFLVIGTFTATQAIPPLFGSNGTLSMWKCNWNSDLSITDNGDGSCGFTRSQTCTHWLWGSRTNGYEWSKPCGQNGTNGDGDDKPFDCPCGVGVEAHLIADAMVEINASGISVPSQFMDETILSTDNQVLEDCFVFRMTLAGYDMTDPQMFDPCYIPSTTLPVQVTLFGPLPIKLDCATVAPNPVSDILSINLNGLETQITKIQLIANRSGLVVLELANPVSPIVTIDVNNYDHGLYNLLLFRNEEVLSNLIQIIN